MRAITALPLLLACACATDQRVCAADCASPILLTVHGTAAGGAPQVTFTGIGGNCQPDVSRPSSVRCYAGSGAGTFAFDLSAPGYKTQHVEVTVESVADPCAECGHITEQLEITLEQQ